MVFRRLRRAVATSSTREAAREACGAVTVSEAAALSPVLDDCPVGLFVLGFFLVLNTNLQRLVGRMDGVG